MPKLDEVVANCRKAIRKQIYTVSEAGALPGKWHAHKTRNGSLMNEIESVRNFDVISSGEWPATVSWGTSSNDRDVKLNIVIGYGTNEDWNELAQSDFLSIRHLLHNFDISTVSGLNYFTMEEPYEWKEDDDFRYLIIPVVARITTTNQ